MGGKSKHLRKAGKRLNDKRSAVRARGLRFAQGADQTGVVGACASCMHLRKPKVGAGARSAPGFSTPGLGIEHDLVEVEA